MPSLWNAMAFVLAMFLAGSIMSVRAATFCVGNATALETALGTAGSNSENNTIKVRSGTYAAPFGGFSYTRSAGNHDLDLEGGWNAGCTAQRTDASLTVLDGQGLHSVLDLNGAGAPGLTGNITVRYFDLYNGIDEVDGPVDALTGLGDLTIENCRIRFNSVGASGRPAVFFISQGSVIVIDSLFADNTAPQSNNLVRIDSGTITVNNSTFTGNVFGAARMPQGSPPGTLYLVGQPMLANNILWDNGGSEVIYSVEPLLLNNDIDVFEGTPATGSAGNIDADPQFLSATNRRLYATSPARDTGDNSPPGGTRAIDLDGNPRVVFGTVDMGAYEVQDEIFADGFDGA